MEEFQFPVIIESIPIIVGLGLEMTCASEIVRRKQFGEFE